MASTKKPHHSIFHHEEEAKTPAEPLTLQKAGDPQPPPEKPLTEDGVRKLILEEMNKMRNDPEAYWKEVDEYLKEEKK